MKLNGLLSEIVDAVVKHERKKVQTEKPNYFLNQKKQLWYGLMNSLDEPLPEDDSKDGDSNGAAPEP